MPATESRQLTRSQDQRSRSFPAANCPAGKQEEASLCPGEVLPAWRPDLWSYSCWAEFITERAGRSLCGQERDCRSEGAAESSGSEVEEGESSSAVQEKGQAAKRCIPAEGITGILWLPQPLTSRRGLLVVSDCQTCEQGFQCCLWACAGRFFRCVLV